MLQQLHSPGGDVGVVTTTRQQQNKIKLLNIHVKMYGCEFTCAVKL